MAARFAAQRGVSQVAQILEKLVTRWYLDRVRAAHVFFVRPHQGLVRDNGVRHGANWTEVVRTDGVVLGLLAAFGIPYVPLDCAEVADRLRVITAVI